MYNIKNENIRFKIKRNKKYSVKSNNDFLFLKIQDHDFLFYIYFKKKLKGKRSKRNVTIKKKQKVKTTRKFYIGRMIKKTTKMYETNLNKLESKSKKYFYF